MQIVYKVLNRYHHGKYLVTYVLLNPRHRYSYLYDVVSGWDLVTD